MAIAPGVPDVEVTIEVDNTALPEYQHGDAATTNAELAAFEDSVIRYLEVPSGVEFSVRWLLKEPFDVTRPTYAAVMLDGSYLHGPLRETGDKDDVRGYKYARTVTHEGGQSYTQSFRFSELELDDEPHATNDLKRQLEGVGTITVYLYFVIGEKEAHDLHVPRLDASQLGPINEKISQKYAPTLGDVLTHQTSLTAPQIMHSSVLHEVQTEPNWFASYTFLYRSTGALKSLGIIPRTPSPSRSPTPALESAPAMRDPDTMSREELIAALNAIEERNENTVRIKREREEEATAFGYGVHGDEIVWLNTRPAKKREFVILDE